MISLQFGLKAFVTLIAVADQLGVRRVSSP